MKKILIVIFFFAIISVFFIYFLTNKKENNILLLGENIYGKTKYDSFFYDKITYKELINNIKSNDYYILKDKKVYLTQLIASSKYIIISSNSEEYKKYCTKTDSRFINYKKRIAKNINDFYNLIKRFSSSKLIIIGNYCDNKDNSLIINEDIIYIENKGNININDIIKLANKY